MPAEFEPVLFVFDYWDQPRAGIALYHGVPHRFLCMFDDTLDDYPEIYLLAPIADDVLFLEREAWDIYYGHSPCPELPSVLPKPIPRFPEGKPRYDEIQSRLAEDRNIASHATMRAKGRFVRQQIPPDWNGRESWHVAWEVLPVVQ